MKHGAMLQTGYRQIAILYLLYKQNLSKDEVIEKLYSGYGIKISKETLKLDINTLVNAGFEINRGHKGNKYKMHLNKNFTMLKFNKFDDCIFMLIKDYVLEMGSFDEIYSLKKLYEKFSPFFDNNDKSSVLDFHFFNYVDREILENVVKFKKNQETCDLTYRASNGQNKQIAAIIKDINLRNGKIYTDCILEDIKESKTLRLDNIEKVEKSKTEILNREVKIKKTRYVVKKEYFENYPIENNEKIINDNKNSYEIELLENNVFFIVQRILTLGENCIKIKDDFIKNQVIKSIEETLELYK